MGNKIYTYLIQSIRNNSYYTGISKDPQKRLEEHNSGKLKTTAKNKPYKLVYKRPHNNYKEARRHEKWLKKKNRAYKEMLTDVAPRTSYAGQAACPACKGRGEVRVSFSAQESYGKISHKQ